MEEQSARESGFGNCSKMCGKSFKIHFSSVNLHFISSSTHNLTITGFAIFIKRQFEPHRTYARIIFDLAFGVIFPMICFAVEYSLWFSVIPEHLRTPVYLIVGISMLSLFLRLLIRGNYNWLNIFFFCPVFLFAAIFSIGFGLLLLPLSIMALPIGLGLLGFVPFLTAFVYWRNFVITYKEKKRSSPIIATLALTLIVGGVVFGVGYYIEKRINHYEQLFLSSDEGSFRKGLDGLKQYSLFKWGDYRRLWRVIDSTNDEKKRKRLKEGYEEVTGRSFDRDVSRNVVD